MDHMPLKSARSLFAASLLGLVAAAGLAAPAFAQDTEKKEGTETKTLKAGDKAPALAVKDWVKGEPVTGFEKGRVYVVEFWATWCGPCIASMPHLSEIQHEYKDKGLTVIGVTSEDPNNTLDGVKKMVQEKGDGMGYTVAWDDGRKTNDAFMKAAKQRGIPTSFVVDKEGTIAYIGHPMTLDMVIDDVVAGKWDAKTGGEKIKGIMAEQRAIYEKMEGDPAGALKAMSEFEGKYPKLAKGMTEMKYMLQVKAGDAGAKATGTKLVDGLITKKDSQGLNAFAWGIVDPEGDMEKGKRDYDLAMKAAEAAVKLTDNKDAAILDTLARCYFEKGDKAKAIEVQTKAVELAPAQMKEQLRAALDEYKKAK